MIAAGIGIVAAVALTCHLVGDAMERRRARRSCRRWFDDNVRPAGIIRQSEEIQ